MTSQNIHASASGGRGTQLANAVIIVAGVSSLVASLISILSIWLQTKNYRKPLLQRYVVRILVMVPIYSAASWGAIESLQAALYLDPLRDIYEAFTIYTFLQLLVNFLGGERSLIIMMHGRQPVSHPWPLSGCLAKVDISDPHTFLTIKRGILQYAYLKPVLSLATIIMKLTNTYSENYISVTSGYLWVGIFYNLSVSISLYSLAMFWVCMHEDLKPFRPMPKFLCIKLIIFASYWQGFFLSILQFLGAIPNVAGYSADNLAAAIQDAMICFEMPIFAISHWYAFSWHDYADNTISAARMPVKFALRDSFGIVDLIEDTKETWKGKAYDYRSFDSGDNVIAHEESRARVARMMAGMRYERGGKGKYWIPQPHSANAKTPLLSSDNASGGVAPESRGRAIDYRAADPDWETAIDPEDERLYENARALEYGDWNYPVITAHHATRADWMNVDPRMVTTSTNRNLIQPTKDNRQRRRAELRESISKGKGRSRSRGSGSPQGAIEAKLRNDLSPSPSGKTDRSQLVDLVVEDTEAEQVERVRARKEGGDTWNYQEQKRFVRTYSIDSDAREGDEIREGFDPSKVPADPPPEEHAISEYDDPNADPKYHRNGSSSRYDTGLAHYAEEENVWK